MSSKCLQATQSMAFCKSSLASPIHTHMYTHTGIYMYIHKSACTYPDTHRMTSAMLACSPIPYKEVKVKNVAFHPP